MSDDWRNQGAQALETPPPPAEPADLIGELEAAHRDVKDAQQTLDARLDVRNDLLKIAVAEGYSLSALARTLRLSRQRVHQLTDQP